MGDRPDVGEFLLSSLDLMSALTVCVEALSLKSNAINIDSTSKCSKNVSSSSSIVDGAEGSTSSASGINVSTLESTRLIHRRIEKDTLSLLSTFQMTDLAGTISMLYGILLYQGSPPRPIGPASGNDCEDSLPILLPHEMHIVNAAIKMLHRISRQHLLEVQEILGQEGISLEFRHIATYLIWYCQVLINKGAKASGSESGEKDLYVKKLLHEFIILVGYFAANNANNQTIAHSGHRPTILQQLCSLPFPYFSQPELKKVLFPTLLAICYNNKENMMVLEKEMNWELMNHFLYSPSENGQFEPLAKLILEA